MLVSERCGTFTVGGGLEQEQAMTLACKPRLVGALYCGEVKCSHAVPNLCPSSHLQVQYASHDPGVGVCKTAQVNTTARPGEGKGRVQFEENFSFFLFILYFLCRKEG
jgi:hypothetical protein